MRLWMRESMKNYIPEPDDKVYFLVQRFCLPNINLKSPVRPLILKELEHHFFVVE